jgi:hypothetical protein
MLSEDEVGALILESETATGDRLLEIGRLLDEDNQRRQREIKLRAYLTELRKDPIEYRRLLKLNGIVEVGDVYAEKGRFITDDQVEDFIRDGFAHQPRRKQDQIYKYIAETYQKNEDEIPDWLEKMGYDMRIVTIREVLNTCRVNLAK